MNTETFTTYQLPRCLSTDIHQQVRILRLQASVASCKIPTRQKQAAFQVKFGVLQKCSIVALDPSFPQVSKEYFRVSSGFSFPHLRIIYSLLFRERKGEKKGERETWMGERSLPHVLGPGTKHTTWACALIRRN